MFGLDERIAHLSGGSAIVLVIAVGVLLGLRHATDPDHLAAMSALVASSRDRAARRLGAWWGVGHAVAMVSLGLPIVLFGRHLPGRVQQGAELAVAVLIVALAVRLFVRWRRDAYHAHEHAHDDGNVHVHLHSHAHDAAHRHEHRPTRTSPVAFGIGLVHGVGGSAGVSILVLASAESRSLAVVSLLLLGLFTIVSMWLFTAGFGAAITRRRVRESMRTLRPTLAALSLGFGVWYGAGA
ncbi:MAG: hypothetical protein ACE5FC_11330, partial [Myxococcota bacterium]